MPTLQDSEGLRLAYDNPDSVVVIGTTMYIAGTHPGNLHDWYDDVTKIPTHTVYKTERYQQAMKHFGKGIKTLVGHSLGGSVALELQKNYPYLVSRTYGAPVMGYQPGTRYRHYGDPVSMFDFGATSTWASEWNPHAYTGFGSQEGS